MNRTTSLFYNQYQENIKIKKKFAIELWISGQQKKKKSCVCLYRENK